MNRAASIRLVSLLSCSSLLLSRCGAAEASRPNLGVWAAAAAQMFFHEDNPPTYAEAEIRLDAAANETEAAQVILRVQGSDLVLTNAALGEFAQTNHAAPLIRAHSLKVEYVYLPDLNRVWPSGRGDCGDGSLVYPGDRVGINGRVTSIRLELLRDGVEDFDYLTLFEKARGKEAMRTLIARATTDLNPYTTDPAVLDALRREMADTLEGNSSTGR